MFNNNDEHLKEQGIYDDEDVLERFVPVAVEDLVEQLTASTRWNQQESELFGKVAEMFVALYHAQFHKNLRRLKRNYHPYSPDRDTVVVNQPEPDKEAQQVESLRKDIEVVLDRANFEPLSIDQINESLNKVSPYGVQVSVNLDEFDQLAVYYRGTGYRMLEKRRWETLWLKKRSEIVSIYRRLFVMIKPIKPDLQKEPDGLLDVNCIYLKLFKNIPQHDLEMLFPNTQVRMRLFDKVKLGVTGGGGTITGLAGLVAKLYGAAVSLAGVVVALIGFGAVIWRQIANIFSHRTKYMAELTRNLYFYNLNNNVGAISQLVDMAEGEEFKEAILAYYFLATAGDKKYNQESLDMEIEKHIEQQYGVYIDFEITDGLRKLQECNLLQRDKDGILTVVSLQEAHEILNKLWDDMYDV